MTDFAKIWADAEAAGKQAIADFSAQHGANERSGGYDQGPCGFAWIVIRPARGKFVNWCKAQNKIATEIKSAEKGRDWPMTPYGDSHYNGGWCLWQPGSKSYHGQSVSTYEVAARGFAKVLEANGIPCAIGSRLD